MLGQKNSDNWIGTVKQFTAFYRYPLRGGGNLSITDDNIRSAEPEFPDAKFSFTNEFNTNNFDFAIIPEYGDSYGFVNNQASISINIPWAEANPVNPFFILTTQCACGGYYAGPDLDRSSRCHLLSLQPRGKCTGVAQRYLRTLWRI